MRLDTDTIQALSPMVWGEATKTARIWWGVDADDLAQEAWLAIDDAAPRLDPRRNAEAFFRNVVRRRIKRYATLQTLPVHVSGNRRRGVLHTAAGGIMRRGLDHPTCDNYYDNDDNDDNDDWYQHLARRTTAGQVTAEEVYVAAARVEEIQAALCAVVLDVPRGLEIAHALLEGVDRLKGMRRVDWKHYTALIRSRLRSRLRHLAEAPMDQASETTRLR